MCCKPEQPRGSSGGTTRSGGSSESWDREGKREAEALVTLRQTMWGGFVKAASLLPLWLRHVR